MPQRPNFSGIHLVIVKVNSLMCHLSLSPTQSTQFVYLDANVSIRTHISKAVASCFAAPCRIRSIQCSVSRQLLLALVTTLTLSRLYYGSAILAKIPGYLLDRIWSVQHGWLVYQAHKYNPVLLLHHELHWLRVPECIKYWLAVLVFSCCNNTTPRYLARDLHRAVHDDSRQCLYSARTRRLAIPRTRLHTVGNRAWLSGTPCLHPLCLRRHWLLTREILRLTSFISLTVVDITHAYCSYFFIVPCPRSLFHITPHKSLLV